jgi:hypothetical protein
LHSEPHELGLRPDGAVAAGLHDILGDAGFQKQHPPVGRVQDLPKLAIRVGQSELQAAVLSGLEAVLAIFLAQVIER